MAEDKEEVEKDTDLNPPEECVEEITDSENESEEESGDQELVEAKKDAEEAKKQYLYLTAEFQNFRKRMQKEKSDFLKFGHEDFLRDLLQVQDNFERGIEHASKSDSEKDSELGQLLDGLKMTMVQFHQALNAQGVSEILSVGEIFDPKFHEAVGQEESEDKEVNTILSEHLKGYMLHGRLLRASRVVTAKAVEEN